MSSLTLHECYRDNGLIEDPSSYSTFDHFHEKAQNVDLDVLYIILFGKILPARMGDNGGQDLINPRNDIKQRQVSRPTESSSDCDSPDVHLTFT